MLEQAKPKEIVVPRLFYEDTNSPTLASDLAVNWSSASLWSDEAGLIVGGHGMSDDMAMSFIALSNRLWDGLDSDRDRKTAGRAQIRGRRFTQNLMMQPLVMARLLSLAGGASRAMGLLARFLITWPTSTIGTRKYRRIRHRPAIEYLHQRLKDLLDQPLPLDPESPTIMALAPPPLPFSARAQRLWQWFHDTVEAELGKTGEYADIADIGAKVAENAARLAGDFHVLEHGPTGEIGSKTLCRAIKITFWHLYEARRVLAAFDEPQGVSDAAILLNWLRRQPPEPIDPRRILQFGPSMLRDAKRRDAAIKVLIDRHYLLPCGGAGEARRYLLNPKGAT